MNHPMLATSALALGLAVTGSASAATDKAAVLNNYADIAQAKYEDSLIAAKALRDPVSEGDLVIIEGYDA